MESLRLEGCNGSIGKLKGFKEKTKVQIGKRQVLKCNFANLRREQLAMADQPLPVADHRLPTMGNLRELVREAPRPKLDRPRA